MPYSFADIIIPVAVKGRFTYSIPDNLRGSITPGARVLVQLGNRKLYSGIAARLHNEDPGLKNIRPIMELSDKVQVVNDKQLKFWSWISDYYMCSEGEVMNAALPSIMLPEGVTSSPVVDRYKPREERFIELASRFSDKELNEILDKLKKAPKQEQVLSAYLHMTDFNSNSEIKPVRLSLLLKESSASPAIIDALTRKGILSSVSLKVTR